jgi:hypothetical protein
MPETKTYEIHVCGCDATTTFDMELTEVEYGVINRVALKCTAASTYGCEPTMYINLKEPA